MDKLFKPRISSTHELEGNIDDSKECKSTDIEKKQIHIKSEHFSNKNIKLLKNFKQRIIMELYLTENPNADMDTGYNRCKKWMQLPQETEILAMTPVLMINEVKLRSGLTMQDSFRLRVPKPQNMIQRLCSECAFYAINEPRTRKPLVVLDLDILTEQSENPTILNFLEMIYENFDISIWSSIKMPDLIPKLESLDFFRPQNKFKIVFVLDITSMTHSYLSNTMVKDIEIIWDLYPQYNARNSIIVNHILKKVVDEINKVSRNRTTQNDADKMNKFNLKDVIEYLTKTIYSKRSLLAVNTLMSKQQDMININLN